MKIKWLGQSTFVIKSNTTLVTDPHNPMLGKLPKDLTADVVTVSHEHGDHNYTKGVSGNPQIINKTGKFTVNEFVIKSIATFHDNSSGKKRGANIIYTISAEGLKLCHLGDLGHLLSKDQIKKIGPVDILMIPVGGFFTIDPAGAVKVIGQIKPKIILPMHYKHKRSFMPLPLSTVDKFTDTLKWDVHETDELKIDVSKIKSSNRQVIIFKY